MATLSGEVQSLNALETTVHAVGAVVLVKWQGKTIGSGVVDDNNEFSIDLPDDADGELEVTLGTMNAAPTLVDFHGQDLHIALLFSNVNNFIA